jgi:hypothetical protein
MRFLMSERPGRRGLLIIAAIVVAIEVVAAAGQTAIFARVGYESSTKPFRLVRDADLDPLASFAPNAGLVAALETIPPDATYSIVVGKTPPVADPQLIRLIYQFWLLPRRYTSRPGAARWVIAYHRPSESLGVRYTREVGLAPFVNAVEVGR